MTPEDERLLRRAIELAAEARASGNPPFGSLLTDAEGAVIAEERNSSLSDGDITAHPELKLARWAASELDPAAAATTTMYTSCEPCEMCSGAIARSGLGRVVFALSGEQLAPLKPPAPPGAVLDGPGLFEDARKVVEGYYL